MGAVEDELAAAQHDDAIREALELLEILRDEDDRAAAVTRPRGDLRGGAPCLKSIISSDLEQKSMAYARTKW